MAKNIDPSLKLISTYLKLTKTEYFEIPEYQRAYSWDIIQCDKLWQSIVDFMNSGDDDPYFFGTIIVDCSDEKKSIFSLIDGQQRTTTFLILMKAMLLRINKSLSIFPSDVDSKPLKAGLESRRNMIISIIHKAEAEDIPSIIEDNIYPEAAFILKNNSINEIYPDEISNILISTSYEVIESKVHKIKYKRKENKYTNYFRNFSFFYRNLGELTDSQLNQFARAFLEQCQVIEIRSWQIEQAITMFNSLNSTGQPLSDADIISAQLYSKTGHQNEVFKAEWRKIIKISNELNLKKIADIDSILQQFMYINRALSRDEKGYLSKDGIVDVTVPGLRRYYKEINNELLDTPLEFCGNLLKIADLWDVATNNPLVKILLKFNDNARLYLICYLYRFEPSEIRNNSSKLNPVALSLLKLFILLEIGDLGYSSSKFKTFLFTENLKLVDKEISENEIVNDFSDHITKNWQKETVIEQIEEYQKNLLVYLNEYIYAANHNKSFDFGNSVNIEHIMPSSGKNKTIIQTDAKISSKEEFEDFVNKLGNKILLEEDINKSLSNEWFKTKKQSSVKEKSGYKDSSFAIASSLTNYPTDTWTKEDITKNTEKAARRIADFIFQ